MKALLLSILLSLVLFPLSLSAGEIQGGVSTSATPRLMDPAVGDVNGDGIADVLVGAPGASPDGYASAGSVFLLLGGEDITSGDSIDLTYSSHYTLRIDGAQPSAQLGFRVAIADVNGDGYGDMIMSAPGRRGAVFVRFGEAEISRGSHSLAEKKSVDLVFLGEHEGAFTGATLCTGDLDRDGYADLVLASLGFDDQNQVNATDVHVIPGRERWSEGEVLLGERIPGRILLSRALVGDAPVVHTCALGDLDDDGVGDIALGMALEGADDESEVGSVSIVYDVLAHFGGAVDLGDPDAVWGARIYGSQAAARFGSSVAIADLNADQRDDLIVGAPLRLLKGPAEEGAVYVFWGGMLPEGVALQEEDLVFRGSGGRFGASMQVVDINGDSRDDLVVSAPSAKTAGGKGAGQASLYLGGPQLLEKGPHHASTVISGVRKGEGFGQGSAAADVDNDGEVEWLVRGAGHPEGREATGAIYGFGLNGQPSDLLREDSELQLKGPGWGGGLSQQVMELDIDGDGVEEQGWLSPMGMGNRGVLCFIKGEAQEVELSDPDDCLASILGPKKTALASADVGDFDGDGVQEIALGLPGVHVSSDAKGVVAFVDLPKADEKVEVKIPAKLSKSAQWVFAADATCSGLGTHLSLADLDGDGDDDLIVGASDASYDDRELAGAVLLFKGGTLKKRGHKVDKKGVVWLRFQADAFDHLGAHQVLNFDGEGGLELYLGTPFATRSGLYLAGAGTLVYDVASLELDNYEISDPDLTSLKIVGPAAGAGVFSGRRAADLNGDGRDELLLLSPNLSNKEAGKGQLVVLEGGVSKALKGVLHLSNEHGHTTLYPPRLERLQDAAVVEAVEGEETRASLVVVTRRRDEVAVYQGELEGGVLDPTSGARINNTGVGVVELSTLPGGGWLIFPSADRLAPDQGAAIPFSR